MVKEKKRLACRFGFHSWYVDSALLTQAQRCYHCPAATNKRDSVDLDRERRAWREVAGEGGTFSQRLGKVVGMLSISSSNIAAIIDRAHILTDLPICSDMMGHGNLYGDHFVCASCGGRIPDERTGD